MRRVGLLLVDGVLIALATIFALLLRDNFEFSWTRLAALLPYLALTLTAAAAIFPLFGISRTIWRLAVMNDHLRLFGAIVLTVVAAVTLCFVYNRLENVARALPVLQALLMLVFLVGARVVIRVRYLARAKPAQLAMPTQGAGVGESVIVVGLTRLTELYLRSVAEFAPERVRIAGLLVRSPHQAGRLVHGHQVLGAPDQVADALRELEEHGVMVDRIVVTTAFDRLLDAERDALLGVERSSGIRLEFIAERLGLEEADVARPPAGFPSASERAVVTFAIPDAELAAMARRPYWKIRRVVDVVGALLLLVLLAPVVVLVGILVAIDLGWPVVFWQQRPGLGGRPFHLYKLRTMAAAHHADGRPVPESRRVSRIGRALRRTRIDELPQLVNILRGEMSFIGPRPLLAADQATAYAARLLVRPGLTGWAQVKAGRDVTAANKAALDVWYVRNASPALDLAILLQTLRMLISGERISTAAIRQAWRDLQSAGICGAGEWAAAPRSSLAGSGTERIA
jgi:lipopolysaccharide/colanic/teichoic acid biosynthesis glycosyltransferase